MVGGRQLLDFSPSERPSHSSPKDSLNDHSILQTGNDLTGWTHPAIDPCVTVTSGTRPGDENVEVSLPMEILGGASPRFFVRLKAVRP
jgi:hypothetical protein